MAQQPYEFTYTWKNPDLFYEYVKYMVKDPEEMRYYLDYVGVQEEKIILDLLLQKGDSNYHKNSIILYSQVWHRSLHYIGHRTFKFTFIDKAPISTQDINTFIYKILCEGNIPIHKQNGLSNYYNSFCMKKIMDVVSFYRCSEIAEGFLPLIVEAYLKHYNLEYV